MRPRPRPIEIMSLTGDHGYAGQCDEPPNRSRWLIRASSIGACPS
jgi:hypothetical protein